MPEKKVASFEIKYLQVLDEKGNVDKKLEPNLNQQELKQLYRLLVLTRAFDNIALQLQREGRIGTYASVRGQEAQVGSAFAMKPNDWMFPSFREHGVFITRGTPLKLLFTHWGGSEEGNRLPEDQHNMTVSIPVGTHLLHAVGAGWAAKLKGDSAASVVYFGDGATSEGDFHEALNFAGVFQTPTVFICQNNQWAISIPRSKQTRAETLAQKAIAYGIQGIQVDGNDVLAQYVAAKKALDDARAGKGPTFIECITYRMGAHTTADDPTRYRTEEELKEWEKKDPITRFQIYLKKKGAWTKEFEKETQEQAEKEVLNAVKEYEAQPKPEPTEMFKYVYSQMTPNLIEQLEELKESLKVVVKKET